MQAYLDLIKRMFEKDKTYSFEDDFIDLYIYFDDLDVFQSVFQRISMSLAAAVTVIVLAITYLSAKPYPFFAYMTDQNGFVERVHPYINPPVTDKHAVRWANEKVVSLLSYHFGYYEEQVMRAEHWFTGDGWENYITSLRDNGVIKTVRDEGLIVTSINTSEPIIEAKKRVDGKMRWLIRIPIIRTIQGASNVPDVTKHTVQVVLTEVDRDESLEGVLIKNLITYD